MVATNTMVHDAVAFADLEALKKLAQEAAANAQSAASNADLAAKSAQAAADSMAQGVLRWRQVFARPDFPVFDATAPAGPSNMGLGVSPIYHQLMPVLPCILPCRAPAQKISNFL